MAERPARTPTTQVTRERVIAPPDRFIFGVQDEELITYFSGACRRGFECLCGGSLSAAARRRGRPLAQADTDRAAQLSVSGLAAMGRLPMCIANPPILMPLLPLLPLQFTPADVFGSELAPALPVLHQLVEGICTSDFTSLRRSVRQWLVAHHGGMRAGAGRQPRAPRAASWARRQRQRCRHLRPTAHMACLPAWHLVPPPAVPAGGCRATMSTLARRQRPAVMWS